MKLKQKKSAKLILSDRIAEALTLKPRADIEDDQVFGTKPQIASRADFGSSDSEDEATISDFRKRNVNLLSDVSKKYEGQVISRNNLTQSDSEATEGSSDEVDDLLTKIKQKIQETDSDSDSNIRLPSEATERSSDKANDLLTKIKQKIQETGSDSDNDIKLNSQDKLGSDSEDNDDESDDYSIIKREGQSDSESGDDESEGDDDDEGEGYDISQMTEPVLEEFEHVKKQNISEEAKKGGCVRNQLLLWEGLLEMRIHLQRCMNTANQMPMTDTYDILKENNEFVEENNSAKSSVTTVLDKLLTLQSLLFKNFPETKAFSTKKANKQTENREKKEESDEEIPSDTDNEEIPSDTEPEDNDEPVSKSPKPVQDGPVKKRKLEDYESEISTAHKAFKIFRDTSIQKWNDKTRLATATNIKSTPSNTILQQISYILSDKEKLVKRTQLKRSEYDIVGYKNTSVEAEKGDQSLEVNPVTRSRKDNDEYIPEIFDDSDFYHQLLRELIECKSADISDPVQLSRQWIALQQMRSKMKRKVDTKATKGRKIKYVVHNQLVNYMAPEKSTTWNDESTNELYMSLFGKMFEHNNAGLNGDVGSVFKLK